MKSQTRVSTSALGLPIHNGSVIFKLKTAQGCLENLLAISEFALPSTSATTSGATVSPFSVTDFVSPTHLTISRELSGFFGCLFSAFDIFAQVINLVYLTSPLPDDDVSFYAITNGMTSLHPTEQLTRYVSQLQGQRWLNDLKDFRRCDQHRKVILYTVEMEHGFMQMSSNPTVKAILLPDDPLSPQPNYSLHRDVGVFCVDMLKDVLNAIDHMYGLMEARIVVANQIPV